MREGSTDVERSTLPEERLPHISISIGPSCHGQNVAHGLRLFFSEMIRAKAWVAARASSPEYMFNVWMRKPMHGENEVCSLREIE